MDEIDLTGNPAHVLAAIAKARGELIDDALVQQLAALCDEEVLAPKFLVFVDALAQLCKAHGVTLSTSGYDGLQVWDADDKSGPIHCAGIEDRMKQNATTERAATAQPASVRSSDEFGCGRSA